MKLWIISLIVPIVLPTFGGQLFAETLFRFPLSEEVDLKDPRLAESRDEKLIAQTVFEGLTTLTPDTLEAVGGVAKSWTRATDRVSYLFYLRKDARWSDGRQVVANDFVEAWKEVVATPQRFTDSQLLLSSIKNSAAYRQDGRAGRQSVIVEAEAIAADVLKVVTSHPMDHFVALLALPVFFPKPTKAPGFSVGNGPFVIAAGSGANLRLKKNPHYWGRRQVQLDGIETELLPNPYDVAYRFDLGQLHWTGTVDMSALPPKELESRGRFLQHTMRRLFYLEFDQLVGALKEASVRRALSLALNREWIQKYVLVASVKGRVRFFPEGAKGYQSKYALAHEPSRARRQLKQAGYCVPKADEACKPLPKLEIWHQGDSRSKKLAFAVHSMWQKELGINSAIRRAADAKTAGASRVVVQLRQLWLEVSQAGHLFERWRRVASKPYAMTLAAAASASARSRRRQLLRQAEKLLVTNLPVIPLVESAGVSLVSQRVLGFYDNPLDIHPLKHIYFGSDVALHYPRGGW